MAAAFTVSFDSSDMLEVLKEAAELVRQLGERVPPRVRERCEQINKHADGFFELKTETGQDGSVAIRLVAGHELLCILADLRAEAGAASAGAVGWDNEA